MMIAFELELVGHKVSLPYQSKLLLFLYYLSKRKFTSP